MSENPYASPATSSEPAPIGAEFSDPQGLPVTTQGKRFLNMIIDNIVTQVISGAAGFLLGISYAVSQGGRITRSDEATLQMVGFFLGLLIALGYFVVMEGLFQRTVGKFLTGTYVVSADGQRHHSGKSLVDHSPDLFLLRLSASWAVRIPLVGMIRYPRLV